MRSLIISLACVLILACPLVRADLKEGKYAPDIEAEEWLNVDEPISLAELRGMTVVLFFWVSWHPGGENVMPLMNLVGSQFGRARGVYIIGLTDADRVRVEPMLKKELVMFPVGTRSDSYKEYDISSFPRVVVIDPNGKIAWSGWPGASGINKMMETFAELISQSPPTKTHPIDRAVVEEELQRAWQHLSNEEFRQAFHAAEKADGHALLGDRIKNRCHKVLDLLELVGRDELAQASNLADDKKFEQAVLKLRDIKTRYLGLHVGRAARLKLNALKKRYDEVEAVLDRLKRKDAAERLLYDATELLRTQPRTWEEIGQAYEILERIAEDYPDVNTAQKAKTILERMRDDRRVMDHVRDYQMAPECRDWLSRARSYLYIGENQDAEELFMKVMKECDGTIWADEAAMELKKMP